MTETETLSEIFQKNCADSSVGSEWTFHQLSPYIGKIKSSIAKFLIENFTKPGYYIYDPFCGAGTIPFEAWALNRNIIANDLNKYAYTLTLAKLYPPDSLEIVLQEIEKISEIVEKNKQKIDLRKSPKWVREFFDNETLREIIAWVNLLKENNSNFLLSCILGILHHQRPGFLSYPSSHTVPYLRKKSFPKYDYPEMYKYRSVKDRLVRKVNRAYRRTPLLDKNIERLCLNIDARNVSLNNKQLDAIISSPPYMRKLDYARDNRLRLWFLGVNDIKKLDKEISPKEIDFLKMMTECLCEWKKNLKIGGKCILFLGDNYIKKYKMKLPEAVEEIAVKEVGGYKTIFKHVSVIPDSRRVRRNHKGNNFETILVFELK